MTTKVKKTKELTEHPVQQSEFATPELRTPEPTGAENPSAAEQMVSKADAIIAETEHRLRNMSQQITAIHTELEMFPQGRQERAAHLQEARTAYALANDTYTKAVSYAKLAQETTNEQEAVQAVSRTQQDLEARRNELARVEQEVEKAEQIASDREQELSSTLATLQADQEQLQVELHNTRDARRQAYAELGEQKRAAIMAIASEYQRQIDARRSELLTAQVAFHDYLKSTLPGLQDWREHYRAVRELLPATEDGTSKVIDAAVTYMDTLLREGKGLKKRNPDMHIPCVQSLYISWMSFLVVDASEIDALGTSTARLADRKMQLEHIQKEYREYLAENV